MNRQLECVRAKTENAETLWIEPWNCGIASEWPERWPRGERTEHCAVEAAPRNLAAGSGVAGHYDGVARGCPAVQRWIDATARQCRGRVLELRLAGSFSAMACLTSSKNGLLKT